jgi:hypothetical protein
MCGDANAPEDTANDWQTTYGFLVVVKEATKIS